MLDSSVTGKVEIRIFGFPNIDLFVRNIYSYNLKAEKMKTVFCYYFIVTLLFIMSCRKDNPCDDIFCSSFIPDNNCESGVCTCEAAEFGALDVVVECTNCRINYRLNVKLIVGGITLNNVIVEHQRESRFYFDKFDSGVYEYQLVNGSRILEQGEILIKKCDKFYLKVVVSR